MGTVEVIKKIKFIQERKFTKTDKGGYVYLLYSGGRCKIGISTEPEKRIETITTSSPFDVFVLCVRYFYDRVAIEKLLHRHYKELRKKGEWFELSRDQVFECCGLLEAGWFVGDSEKLEKPAEQALLMEL